jgi:hypothetical protein
MKMIRRGIILLITVSTLLIPSCKKKNENPHPEETSEAPVKPVSSGTFLAKINGAPKKFGANYYMVSDGVGTTITVSETGGTGITLAFFSTTTGTYDVDGILTQAYYYVGSTQHTAVSGKIIITKAEDNKLSGRFYFAETGGVRVTEGIFTDVPQK